MIRKIIAFGLAAWVLLVCPVAASAQEFNGNRTGSISMTLLTSDKKPIVGAEFEICYVADVGINTDKKLNYAYTEIFENCDIPLTDPQLAVKLSTYIEKNKISGEKMKTDTQGNAQWKDLTLGLYLVRQTGAVADYSTCSPFLVTVPIQNDAGFTYDVNASPKTDIVRQVSVSIKKVWNTDKATKIPNSVTVQLLRDGTLVKTASLDSGNNWQITYEDMPESDAYTVREIDVPEGFTATISQEGHDFVITNTAYLAQTGQLIWPIPVLAMAGLILLATGFVILRKTGKKNG